MNRLPVRLCLSAALVVLLGLRAGTATAGAEELSADIVTGLLPLTAYAIAHFKDDDEGEKEFLRSTAASLVVNTSLRLAFNQTSWGVRPNGRPYSFPSGHVTLVVSGAAFLQDRYGWKYGAPAYALSAYVAWLRVDTGHHYWRDAVGGAALGYGVSKLFVTPQNATHIAPIIGPEFIGMRWQRSY